MNKYLKQSKRIFESPLVHRLRLKSAEIANIDVSPAFIMLACMAKLGFRFTYAQIKIRPRLRLAFKVILTLVAVFQLSNMALAALEPREAEIKINGKAILVAQDQAENNEAEIEINQAYIAKLSPFEFRMPISGTLSQGYRGYHRANDIAAPFGTPIHPVGAGIVEFAGRVGDGKGNIVVIDHGDNLKSLYAHMGRIEVGVGNTVDTKTEIGTIGLTGRTTGPHVHLEIYDHDVLVNPASILPEGEI